MEDHTARAASSVDSSSESSTSDSNASSSGEISAARFEGRPVVRACITSHRTTVADLERLVAALNAARD